MLWPHYYFGVFRPVARFLIPDVSTQRDDPEISGTTQPATRRYVSEERRPRQSVIFAEVYFIMGVI
jgi:hypothetical protein